MEGIDWEKVRDYYDAGHSRKECHEAFGFSDWDWHAAVGRGNLVPRAKGPIRRASKRRELIARLRAEGLSYNAISCRLGVSKATVAYHSRRLGVPADDRFARRYDWNEVQAAVDSGSRLINEGLKENRCEICGITEWRGKPLSMQLHHVNGDGVDNRLENLQLLCGNCHSQTDNWGGRGTRRRARPVRRKRPAC